MPARAPAPSRLRAWGWAAGLLALLAGLVTWGTERAGPWLRALAERLTGGS